MAKTKEWFSVSKEGLKELQAGKPKSYILRELIQNAWDENISKCIVNTSWDSNKIRAEVIDDNPEGFKDITDSYTLFKHTTKRDNPTKRGRFNLGEKQAFSVCDQVTVTTVKGTVIFDKDGRAHSKLSSKAGSRIEVCFKATKKENEEILTEINSYLPPKNITYTVNGLHIEYEEPDIVFKALLTTEKNEDGIFKRPQRNTEINLHAPIGKARIYEMGIPVFEIECKYDIDVQQKIPLSIDRETILPSFMKDIYAEILNKTHYEIAKDESSSIWVREAMTDERVSNEAIAGIVKTRYGENSCIANPFDKKSIDDAISHGFNVVHGSELSKEEWDNIRKANAIKTSTQLFGQDHLPCIAVPELSLTEGHKYVRSLTKKIAKEVLKIEIDVKFIRSQASIMADYGSRTLRFNLSRISKGIFTTEPNESILDLIIHELGHEGGMHTEIGYHQTITKIGACLAMRIAMDQDFFVVDESLL